MLKSKISGTVQEVVLPDFPDDENTVTTTVTKSRRVSFGTNFVKEFIVGSAVSAQCMSEYEQAFPSSDSSNADSSHSAAEIPILDQSKFVIPESLKVFKSASTVNQPVEPESTENHPKPPKFSRTICFNADSPTADMEFTEGCITLAKSILDKKNKEMTVIIQAVAKESKEEKPKEDDTKYFDASQFEMSMTRCLKSKENKQEEKKFESEKTKIFSKFEDEMSITRCNKIFNDDESDSSLENCKENLIPLDMIMQHLDKDNSDFENDLFNPKKSFSNFLNASPFDISSDSEKLNLNESMDISTDFHPNVFKESQSAPSSDKPSEASDLLSKVSSIESMEISSDFQPDVLKLEDSTPFFERPNSDQSEKIYTDLQSDILETSQNPVKSDEAVDFAKTTKSDHSETVFSNVIMETTLPVGKVIEISLQSEDGIIEGDLTNPKKADGVNSNELLEIIPEVEHNDFENLSENKAMDISNEKVDVSADTKRPPVDEKNTNEAGFNDLEKPNSEEDMGITTDDQSNAVEPFEKPNSEEDMGITTDDQSNAVEPFEKPNSEEDMGITTDDQSNAAEPFEKPNSEMDMGITTDDQSNAVEPFEKPNSEEDMGITADNQSNAFESLEKPQPTEAVTVDNSDKLILNESIKISTDGPSVNGPEIRQNSPTNVQVRKSIESNNESDEADDVPMWNREPSLVDVKMIESLKEQSKEPGCIWSLIDLRYPRAKTSGLLSFNCELLNSTTTINFYLKMSSDDSLDSCSIIEDSLIDLNEEKHCRLPEYGLVIGFGFQELKKFFDERRQKIETIRHIPFFLDQINSFLFRMNSYLRQIYSILTLYPGSRLKGSLISFRLYSFPIFFSCVVSIDLTDLFRLSETSLSFENDFGTLDENRIREIFQRCLKNENSLCEFVVESTKYLVELEKKSGYVSKRGHIRLLPVELKL